MTTLITVLGTIFGVGIGSYLTSNNEHKKWLREKRYDAFSALSDTGMDIVTFPDYSIPEALVSAFSTALARASVLTPTRTKSKIDAVHDDLDKAFDRLDNGQEAFDMPSYLTFRENFGALLDEMTVLLGAKKR